MEKIEQMGDLKESTKTQTCRKCGKEKPATDEYFYINRRREPFKLGTACKVCINADNAKWAKDNPERDKYLKDKSYMRLRYTMSPESKKELFENQGSCCAICKTTNSGHKDWNIDHDHKTGAIRGILCCSCNQGLGLFKDNPIALAEAARYIHSKSTGEVPTGAQ